MTAPGWQERAERAESRLAVLAATNATLTEALERIKANAESWHGSSHRPAFGSSDSRCGFDRALCVVGEWATAALAGATEQAGEES